MPQPDGTARDNTGQGFQAPGRTDPRRLPHQSLMRNPKYLRCPNCEHLEFRIVADDSDHAVSGLIQIQCATPRCKTVWPEVQLAKPQLNHEVARDAKPTELWAPPIIEDIDIPRS